jgi:hypothetical protein
MGSGLWNQVGSHSPKTCQYLETVQKYKVDRFVIISLNQLYRVIQNGLSWQVLLNKPRREYLCLDTL